MEEDTRGSTEALAEEVIYISLYIPLPKPASSLFQHVCDSGVYKYLTPYDDHLNDNRVEVNIDVEHATRCSALPGTGFNCNTNWE